MEVACGVSAIQPDPKRSLAEAIDGLVEVVHRASSWGAFHYISFPHHFLSYPRVFPSPFVLMARLAPVAGDMWLAPNLLMPMYNPVLVAEEAATLDHICHGRFILCLLLGYRPLELEATGIERKDRVPRMEESIMLMKRLWAGEEVTFHSKYFHVSGGKMGITPLQKPHPPIWLSAQSHGAASRAGRLADGCRIGPWVGWDDFLSLADTYRRAFAEAGRKGKPTLCATRIICLAKDPKTAIKEHRAEIQHHHAMYHEWGMQEKTMVSLRLTPEQVGDCVIAGTYQDCLETLKRHEEMAGLSIALPNFLGMPREPSAMLDYLQAFVEEVVRKL